MVPSSLPSARKGAEIEGSECQTTNGFERNTRDCYLSAEAYDALSNLYAEVLRLKVADSCEPTVSWKRLNHKNLPFLPSGCKGEGMQMSKPKSPPSMTNEGTDHEVVAELSRGVGATKEHRPPDSARFIKSPRSPEHRVDPAIMAANNEGSTRTNPLPVLNPLQHQIARSRYLLWLRNKHESQKQRNSRQATSKRTNY